MSEDAARTSIRVEIAGEWYTLRADADEEYTRRCAALVDERMSAVSERAGVTAKNAAILAALSLSDDLLRRQSEVNDRLQALTVRIEAELEGD